MTDTGKLTRFICRLPVPNPNKKSLFDPSYIMRAHYLKVDADGYVCGEPVEDEKAD